MQTQTGEGVPQHDRDRDPAPQRAAATRLRERNEARAERLRADRQRNEASAGDNTSKRGEVYVSIRPGLCLCLCVSVLRALVACKNVWLQMTFAASSFVHHAADRKLQRETKPQGHHFAGLQRTDYVLLRLGRPQGMPKERGYCEAQRPDEL